MQGWYDSMASRGLARATVRRRRLTLTRFATWVGGSPVDATSTQVEGWLRSLPVSPQSRAYYAKDLRAFYRWAIREGLCTSNPLDGREPEKMPRRLPRPISTSELARAVAQADPRMRTILVLAAFAGLRAAEIASLDATDIDRERGRLWVRGKGGRERFVPLHPLVAEVTANVRRGAVVQRLDGRGGMNAASVSALAASYLRSIGINKTLHQLRHWFATEVNRKGKSLRTTQELLGHASPGTTAVYTLVDDDEKEAAVEALTLAVA